MNKLKKQSGKDIWLYGGAELISSFMNLDLVDEFRIAIMPVVLGAGKPLFKNITHRANLKLAEVKTSTSGVMQVYYEIAR